METSKTPKSPILLPWRLRHPIRVRVSNREGNKTHEYHVEAPFRVGYDKQCEVPLEGTAGPQTLFEFSPVSRPVKLSTPIRREVNESDLSISVDGNPLQGANLDLKSGSIVNIQDSSGQNEVTLTVDVPESVSRRLKVLSALLLLGMLTMTAYSIYTYQSLQTTRSLIAQSEARISQTESGIQAQDAGIKHVLTQFQSNELSTELALNKIDEVQRETIQNLRTEFTSGINFIRDEIQQDLLALAEDDTVAREALATKTEHGIEQLRADISEKMFATQEKLKQAQQDVLLQNTRRLDSLEFKNERFKSILANSTDAVIYVRTTYEAEMLTSASRKTLDSYGTGFIVDESGVALTPQHVFKPWLYDESLQVMVEIGMVRILPDSVRHTIWTAGQQVVVENTVSAEYMLDTAFTENAETRALRLLYAPEPTTAIRQVNSPFGTVEIEIPVPGPSDIAVIQLIDFARQFTAIEIESGQTPIEPLDEVLLVGYPLSRLSDGRSVPQAVRGFVRRPATDEMLELHSAVHPGTSGAPVINSQGHVIGMAVAMFGSDSYGAAIPYTQLSKAITAAESAVNELKQQYSNNDCPVGPMNGRLDAELWQAIQDPRCQPANTNNEL